MTVSGIYKFLIIDRLLCSQSCIPIFFNLFEEYATPLRVKKATLKGHKEIK